MKTRILKPESGVRAWRVIDADGVTLGRLASRAATILMGKDKPAFSPHQDWGDYLVVVNAKKVKVTGRKAGTKTYFSHSGYVGNEKLVPYATMLEKKPTEIIRHAIRGMIQTKGPLGRAIAKKLFVYAGADHPHVAQKPETVKI